MIDIQNIKNSPILMDPWPHKVIDNFFDKETFDKIRQTAQYLKKYCIDGKTNPFWLNEALEAGADPATVEDIITATDIILDNIQTILDDFPRYNKSNIGYYAMPKFGISGRDFKYPVHSESSHKVLLFVIYLEPEDERGTRLYSENDESKFVKEIEWKLNRAFLMCPGSDDTWHNWQSNGTVPRITLNIFCEKLESMSSSLTESAPGDNPEGILWLYEKIGQNRLTTNKF